MKFWLCLLIASPLLAQPSEGTDLIDMGGDIIKSYGTPIIDPGHPVLYYSVQYSWSIIREADGSKAFTFTATRCTYYSSIPLPLGLTYSLALPMPMCVPLSESAAEALGPIAAAIQEFNNYHPSAPHLPLNYLPYPGSASGPYPNPIQSVHRQLSTVPPVVQPDPQIVFLDGFSTNIVQFDLTTFAMTSQITLPDNPHLFGIRPTSTGPENEVWAAIAGSVAEISICDLGAQAVLANIPIPSLVPSNTVPVGIVFANDGATAFYAVKFFSADSSGNNGALVVLDAVNRKVISTLPLKYAPAQMLKAPDGMTLYLLSATNGELTYYDVLSGTADLSLTTYTPGVGDGFSGQAFISTDGTQLFWNTGYVLDVFDINSHAVVGQINSGLPSTSAVSTQMSQDGSTIWMENGAGTVAPYDVRSGVFLGTFTTDPGSVVYPGPAN